VTLVKPITLSDEPFLWEMLYQAIYVPPGSPAPPRQIVSNPDLSRYVQGWGKAGDFGLIALIGRDRLPAGAAWLRLLTEDNEGYGYVDDLTPELCISVLPESRGMGIGTQLLNQLFENVQHRHQAVSLSVSKKNPALRLYRRLGFEVVSQLHGSLTMKKALKRDKETGNNAREQDY